MEWPQPSIGTDEVHEMIRGYDGGNPGLDPIECLQQAEGPGWKLDACRFLLSQALIESFDTRERPYLTECAAMTLASAFDVLLHEVVHYYGLSMTPKKVRWDEPFRVRLAKTDTGLAELLADVRQAPWFRRAMGLRHYVTHHGGLWRTFATHCRSYSSWRAHVLIDGRRILRSGRGYRAAREFQGGPSRS